MRIFRDIRDFLWAARLICPDHCLNIVTYLIMIVIGTLCGSLEGAMALLAAGMVGITMNLHFIKTNLRLR